MKAELDRTIGAARSSSPLIHATRNLLAKRAAAGVAAFVAAYNLVARVIYAPWVGQLLVHGALRWSWPVAACIGASGLFDLAYSLSLQRGYQIADLCVVYPVAGGTGPTLRLARRLSAARRAPDRCSACSR